ncbi:MAG: hypothetical protein ACR2HO_02595 [Rubrobacteraceae bacterium]
MAATLTVRDETTSPLDRDHVFLLDLPSGRVTVEELIRARVHREVEDFNASRPGHFRGLVQPSGAERTLNGFRVREGRKIDSEEQCGKAMEAFGRNGFILLVDDRQAEELDEEIEVCPETTVTFLKLVPLVGG